MCSHSVTPDEVIVLLQASSLPLTVKRHATVAYQILRRTGRSSQFHERAVACACLLFALKERNCTHLANQLGSFRPGEAEAEIVAVELFLAQVIREPILLVEACVRVHLKHLLALNVALHGSREDIARVTLALMEQVYGSDLCLFPDTAAAAALLTACELLELGTPLLPPSFASRNTTVVKEWLLRGARTTDS